MGLWHFVADGWRPCTDPRDPSPAGMMGVVNIDCFGRVEFMGDGRAADPRDFPPGNWTLLAINGLHVVPFMQYPAWWLRAFKQGQQQTGPDGNTAGDE